MADIIFLDKERAINLNLLSEVVFMFGKDGLVEGAWFRLGATADVLNEKQADRLYDILKEREHRNGK